MKQMTFGQIVHRKEVMDIIFLIIYFFILGIAAIFGLLQWKKKYWNTDGRLGLGKVNEKMIFITELTKEEVLNRFQRKNIYDILQYEIVEIEPEIRIAITGEGELEGPGSRVVYQMNFGKREEKTLIEVKAVYYWGYNGLFRYGAMMPVFLEKKIDAVRVE